MRARWDGIILAATFGLLFAAADASAQGQIAPTTGGKPITRPPLAVSQLMQDGASGQTQNWLQVNGNYEQTRYFPGNQINAGNVRKLVPAFVFQTDVIDALATAPIVVNGVMFVTTAGNDVHAIDAATGDALWHYRHRDVATAGSCCVNANQGVAVSEGRVFMGTSDARLVALDGQTGRVLWSTPLADADAGYSTAMAPVVADGIVIVGIDTGEAGLRGFVKAFAAADGRLLWTFQTIPESGSEGVHASRDPLGRDLHRDVAGEKAALAKDSSFYKSLGGSVAMTPAIDRRSRTVFITVGHPTPRFNGTMRPGDNLYTDSLVALDLDRGTYRWHFQYLPHDLWGMDAASPPVLTHAREGNQRIDVVVHAGKTGHLYVHERTTGRLIRASEPMVAQENLWVVPTKAGERMLPGSNGGVERSAIAINAMLRLAYVPNIRQPMIYRMDDTPMPDGKFGTGGDAKPVPGEEASGRLVAVNLDTGKLAWQVRSPQPLLGGVLATAGELVFSGEANGWFKAWDAKSGEELWKFNCGAGVNAPPSSYMVGRKQYIAVAAGGNARIDSKRGNSVIVFALP